ncbi:MULTISPECIES: hypothetical protein [unclassified Modestobacter]
MSTDGTITPENTPGQPGATAAGTTTAPAADPADTTGAADPTSGEEGEPSWVSRHTGTLIALMVAVIVVAVAITGLILWRDRIADRNAETEAAFRESVTAQGAEVSTVECNGDICSAIIGGSAYTVLVQEDEQGVKQFGVAAFTGR